MFYDYASLADKLKIPDNATEYWCFNNNLSELPELPKSLKILSCSNNTLTLLPELPQSLELLSCNDNNIKYLSYNNCQILKNIRLSILNNPVSEGFNSDEEFQENL